MNLENIINRLGGEAVIAAGLGCGVSAVSNWKARGLPKGRVVDLLGFARSRGVALTLDELQQSANPSAHEHDFYAWTKEQAALLRVGAVDRADIKNIAEEIESMGRSERRELISRLSALLLHLLKWRYQPALRGTSWRLTIKEQRYRLDDHLRDNPSLKAQAEAMITDAYRLARIGAQRETGLGEEIFPDRCPFSFDQSLDDMFLPD